MAEIIDVKKEEVSEGIIAADEENTPAKLVPFETIMHSGYKLSAVEKLRAEAENFNGQKPMAKAIKDAVAAALVSFCDENELISEVIFRTARTLGDCCDFIIEEVEKRRKGTDGFNGMVAMSDTEVFTLALRFYFPDSKVKAHITMELGQRPSEEEMNKVYERPEPPKKAPVKKAEKKKAKNKASDNQQSIEGFDSIPESKRTEEIGDENVVVPQYTEKCADCGTGISDRCVEWSLSNFGKHLCPKCQKEHSRKKSEEQFVQLSLI